MTGERITAAGALVAAALLAAASTAVALPVELKDSNDTKYFINTDVDPLNSFSLASGAVTNATYEKPVTVTSYFIGLTPFGWFLTTYTVQYQVDVPLRNAFAGFNGLIISGANGVPLPAQRPYNPGEAPGAERFNFRLRDRPIHPSFS